MGMSVSCLAVFVGGCVLGGVVPDGPAEALVAIALWVGGRAVGYRLSLRRHPRRNCRSGNGLLLARRTPETRAEAVIMAGGCGVAGSGGRGR